MDFELTDINNRINDCITKACIGSEPIETLIFDNSFIPKEGLLWDYKESINTDSVALAKTILQIVSFHNTCGGYLIYGVKETEKDKKFEPTDIDLSNIDLSQIKKKIKDYTNNAIDFTFNKIVYEINNSDYIAGLLFIPKRQKENNPVSFVKNGPDKKPGKPIFLQDETYFRHLDECIKATTTKDWQTLFSSRDYNPSYGISSHISERESLPISHNLPDKSLICSNFIGRENLLAKLWEWLSDDLEYTKILSGDGGKGKTSIAYQFCKSFIQAAPSGYERVVWISAKEKQFSGLMNNYYELQESDYNDCWSFLLILAENCALDTDNYTDSSIKLIKRDLKDSLKIFPSLYIVDDVDSLEDDEQRKVVDACRQLGSVNIRFLITTRKKLAYSSEICIDVPGLPLPEFIKFIQQLINQYSLKPIQNKEIETLHKTCDGSPLLAASIVRLYKQGIPLSQAIKDWTGEIGEDARSAALRREIDSLTPDAKRVLLAIFYFNSCSHTELRQAVGVENIKLSDCLDELNSLFLVNEPKIIDNENRYSISNTTGLIIAEIQPQMAFDYKNIQKTIKSMKEGHSSKKEGNRKKVGLAINQSLALIKDKRIDDALKTVEQQLRFMPGNADLLLMKARCLLSTPQPEYEESRVILRKSYDSGQRKDLMFELWHESEKNLDSPNGIIEVSTKALEQEDIDKSLWLERLATGYVLRSNQRDSNSEIKDLLDASTTLSQSLKYLDKTSKEIRIEQLNTLHNIIWNKLENSNELSWLSCFDIILQLIKSGDARTKMYQNANRCLQEFRSEGKFSDKKKEAYDICVNKFIKLIDSRNPKDKADRPFEDIKESLILSQPTTS